MSKIPCKICGQPAHGNHFGAVTCRACSAFFRRSFIEHNEKRFTCNRGDDTCQVKFSGKFFCKKCRLRKCYEIGMDTKYFQHNRDKIKSVITPSMSTFIGRPAHIIHCSPMPSLKKSIIDVTSLIDKANELMRYGPIFAGNSEILNRMRLMDDDEKTKKFEVVPILDKTFFLENWENELMKNVQWLCRFDDFHSLPQLVRQQVVLVTWHIRSRIERLVQTSRLRKFGKIGKDQFVVADGKTLDLRNCELDVSWCSKYRNDQILFFLENSDEWVHNELVKYLEDLSPTDIETAFMTCQLCFHYAGKRLQGDVLTTMDRFEDVISNELHDYYRLNNIGNYVDRVAKMMKINNMLQKMIWEKRWKTELAQKFDIFQLEFSHPEMFYDCC